MATHTLVTASALTAVTFSYSNTALLPADLATIANGIKDDLNVAHPRLSGCFVHEGMLYIPNRKGHLQVRVGDVVAIDNQGWPLIVSANSIANGNWTFT